MTPRAILDNLRRRGVKVTSTGDKLRMIPADQVPVEMIPEIRAAKRVLLAILATENNSGYLADDLDEIDRSVLRWLDVTSHPSQRWRERGTQWCGSEANDSK